ncbi:hypothetical protein, partial [Ruminococcus bromii]|uniref:hypothetical protein n=1 Tax=Ruminococcus bromii TaxID=40518 RepID=UPI003FD866D8
MWLRSQCSQQKQSHFGSGTRYTLNGQECGFQYPSAAFLYALRGASHGIASRDFVCHRSPNHSRKRLTLWGRSPQ